MKKTFYIRKQHFSPGKILIYAFKVQVLNAYDFDFFFGGMYLLLKELKLFYYFTS